MKSLIITFLAIFSYYNCISQPNLIEIEKSFIKINDTLIVSKYEVSNKLYRYFINSLKEKHLKEELNIAKIDSSNWRIKGYDNEPFAQYYHLHPSYDDYPVVNISYEAAELFCKWLTEYYNSNLKRKYKKVIFMLPSENEWILAAKDIKDKKILSNQSYIKPIDAYKSNDYGFYNIIGNVSEMLNQKGIAKGGDWKNGKEYLSISRKFQYDGSGKPYIGLRYFAVIIKK
jgi:formylglycine-generating enzyme required for sulfatase activity